MVTVLQSTHHKTKLLSPNQKFLHRNDTGPSTFASFSLAAPSAIQLEMPN